MAHFLDDNIDALVAVRVDLYNAYSTLEAQLYQAGASIKTGDYQVGGAYLQTASTYFHTIKMALAWETSSFLQQTRKAFVDIRLYWPEGNGEVTLDAILSAMVKAQPEQIDYFIGLVDAYRQSLWNKPFNREYYAALARGFQLWE